MNQCQKMLSIRVFLLLTLKFTKEGVGRTTKKMVFGTPVLRVKSESKSNVDRFVVCFRSSDEVLCPTDTVPLCTFTSFGLNFRFHVTEKGKIGLFQIFTTACVVFVDCSTNIF